MEEMRSRYLAATHSLAESAERRGDHQLSQPLRAHELAVAINAGDFEVALPVFEELTAAYVAAERPEPWLVNSLSWASGKFADHLRDRRSNPSTMDQLDHARA